MGYIFMVLASDIDHCCGCLHGSNCHAISEAWIGYDDSGTMLRRLEWTELKTKVMTAGRCTDEKNKHRVVPGIVLHRYPLFCL
mmetsp:Transcript_19393/g.47914  ORF Transcript_19393/g.47914 Transcript_19393/m.47914 type:complete len:83 (-) Transcript_19393:226-474(-)